MTTFNPNLYEIYHGINLALGSTIVNLQAEIVNGDPTSLTKPGRFWVNTLLKEIRYTTLDGDDNVVVKTLMDLGDINVTSSDIVYPGITTPFLTLPQTNLTSILNSLANEISNLKETITNLLTIDEFNVSEDYQTDFNLTKPVFNKDHLIVLLNGVEQSKAFYSLIDNNTVLQVSDPTNILIGDLVKVINFNIVG